MLRGNDGPQGRQPAGRRLGGVLRDPAGWPGRRRILPAQPQKRDLQLQRVPGPRREHRLDQRRKLAPQPLDHVAPDLACLHFGSQPGEDRTGRLRGARGQQAPDRVHEHIVPFDGMREQPVDQPRRDRRREFAGMQRRIGQKPHDEMGVVGGMALHRLPADPLQQRVAAAGPQGRQHRIVKGRRPRPFAIQPGDIQPGDMDQPLQPHPRIGVDQRLHHQRIRLLRIACNGFPAGTAPGRQRPARQQPDAPGPDHGVVRGRQQADIGP